ncbi:gliding motility-associated C-terminal domain-containing protein [Hymenobacter monticola]|uniref:Gliding motility-associated C-terminal domain-containing protein n=1 Tax=Hymenobacter monticola TaxID=1705399 RepID=A0ABY4B7M8_9BACT|nr:gliding motility-associated C-terminal domain-containing protein [Hymenobacter monticola]UOE35040.1 gliding motility-associated C-terminal domain-containing protein [Hymenobacter monticola]
MPNIITPNADGQNDFFEQRFSCLPVQLRVYSRWGQEVFRAEEYANDWNAAGVPAGIYYLVLRDTAGRRYRGWLEVVK